MEQYSVFSQIALWLWVPFSIGLFFLLRPQRAALITILGGEMFLPELVNFKFPFLPPIEKHNLPFLCVLLGCLIRRPSLVTSLPKERWFTLLTLVLIVGATLTGITNADPVLVRKYYPPAVGLTFKDGLYMAALYFCLVSLPFFLGAALFKTVRDFQDLLAGLAIAALVYLPFALFEVRMSPNLHLWVYGYSQHDFIQTMRWGGYRPMVFMFHGIILARFLFVSICASFILSRAKCTLSGIPANAAGWVILVVLVLCKSTGAIIFTIIAVPMLMWGKTKLHARVAVLLASLVFLYPALRAWDLIPTDEILKISDSLVGEERTGSLEFRFRNENLLLEKARQHLVFGWGQYNRNFVGDKNGALAVADGYWVIQFGILGVVGFIACFGPMLIPIFLTRRRLKFIQLEADRRLVGGVALTLGFVALDWVPNGLCASYPYLLAGALAAVTRELMAEGSAPSVSFELEATADDWRQVPESA